MISVILLFSNFLNPDNPTSPSHHSINVWGGNVNKYNNDKQSINKQIKKTNELKFHLEFFLIENDLIKENIKIKDFNVKVRHLKFGWCPNWH